jgi:hypothetical protein
MPPTIDGYEIRHSLEPPHPRCTTSDPVYEARNALGERVAVKLLHLDFPLRDASVAKFREAMNQARAITSPHVVDVIDAGFARDGKPYFAMRFVEGETLARVIDRGVVATAAQTKTVVGELATAATAASAAGCTPHLHTRHVVLSARGARVWNFGVWPWRSWAHALVAGTYLNGGQVTWHANLTPTEAKGMPSTLANTAAQLALIAFSMLTGRHYWNADNDPDSSPMQCLMEVIRGVGEPPSTRTQIALPDGFDAWFTRCLEGGFADPAAAASALPS